MPEVQLTPQQRHAASAVGRSLTVSAAAGSGKTSVLAERCAYLVCDAPQPCGVDELLVLTFTDAAAAEMRSRIRDVLQQRSHRQPHDQRLRHQLLLLDNAQISTIHSFCRRLLRQHFMRLDIDPNASVLDADEAGLMLDEALQRTFAQRDKFGDDRTTAFRRLILHYGGGREETIASYIVRIHRFVRTLQNGEAWLDAAAERMTLSQDHIRSLEREALLEELSRLIDGVDTTAEYVRRCLPGRTEYAGEMECYAEFLRLQQRQMRAGDRVFEDGIREISDYEFKTIRSRLGKDPTPDQKAEKEEAKRRWDQVRDWHKKRLEARFALFGAKQWREGLDKVAPYVRTLIELVREADREHAQAKRQRHVLDFNDLEQMSYQLLADEAGRPTNVAAAMHRQFAHVLVDEYQDINPLQAAILKLVSRESSEESANNLFCVGDVKQSIYGFRMADPQILLSRLDLTRPSPDGHETILLSKNFRSGPQIIAGVNRVFERLMTPALGGLSYGDEHALHPGRQASAGSHPIEMHIIEKVGATRPRAGDEGSEPAVAGDEGSEAEAADTAGQDGLDEWVDVERQAFFIGQRIRRMVEQDGVAYRDIAILLRAATVRAEQMAGILQNMGIPTLAEATTGFFAATEVSDVLALLDVLDNLQQDIPLASVMRSGVTGIRFNESELLIIKRSRRNRPFHYCVRTHHKSAPDSELGLKVRELLVFLGRYRSHVRRRPLPEVLTQIYSETGYLAYVAGRSGGPQRVANLDMLHSRARQFSRFGGQQTLYAFLRFIEKLRRQGQDLGAGSAAYEGADAVRVMTIHNSKGLEFPVVFAANLEKRFNLEDARRTISFDRDEYIGMPVADPARRIRYPSWTSTRVRERLTRRTLGEELRILYVALTRAKDRLILVGSSPIEAMLKERGRWQTHHGPLGELHLLAATSCLDWLLPAFSSLPEHEARWVDPGGHPPPSPDSIFHIYLHASLGDPAQEQQQDRSLQPRRRACAALDPLPTGEPLLPDDPRIEQVFDRLDAVYPYAPLGAVPSVLNVSDFKRRINIRTDEDDLRKQPARRFARLPRPAFLTDPDELTSAEIGTATHLFMQHLDYSRPDRLQEQLEAMVQRGWMEDAEAERIDLPAIAWFLDTDVGRRAIALADRLEREVSFIRKVPTGEFDPYARTDDPQDFIIVRGMVDLLIPTADGYEVVDFKTDRIAAAQIAERAAVYADQIRQYAKAIAGIWRCRVAHAALVFLSPRRIEYVEPTHA